MKVRDQDEKLWRYLGGQPATPGFSKMITSNPAIARRLAELALIECSIREQATRDSGQKIISRRRTVLLSGIGAFLFVALASVGVWRIANQPPPIGTPIAVESDAETRDLVAKIQEGNPVKVSSKPLKMAFSGESTELAFAPDSQVQLRETPSGGKEVQLDSGKLNAQVSPQKAPLKVVTPHLAVEVVGTAFDVDVDEQASRVLVSEGIVEVSAKGLRSPLSLPAGSGWRQNAGGRGFSVATAAFSNRSPTIDESIDSLWSNHPSHPNTFFGEADSPVHTSATDHSSSWKALWTNDALYVLIEVKDSEIGGEENAKVWAKDSVEIFIDADGSRGEKFDGINDYFLFFEPGVAAITPGVGAPDPKPEMTHRTLRTPDGIRAEVRLPWEALGISPEDGMTLAFNVASNDSDPADGKERSQLSWTPKFRDDWSRPNRMGVLILQGPDSN